MFRKFVLPALIGLGLAKNEQPLPNSTLTQIQDFLKRHPDMADNTVNLNVNDYANCSRARPLELYILQDGTSTFQHLLTQVQKVLPNVIDELSVEFVDMRGGLTTFADKPTFTNPLIPCYRQDLAMTSDVAAFKKACGNVRFLSGTSNGWDENSIETLAFAAGSHAGFSKPSERPDAIRIAIVITDTLGRLMQNPPGPANPDLANNLICSPGSDFPPLWQVSQILRDANVYPLALITETYTDHLIHWWKMQLFDDQNDRMGLPKETGMVIPFDMNADSMVTAIKAGVLALDCQLEEFIDTSSTTTTTTTTTEPPTPEPSSTEPELPSTEPPSTEPTSGPGGSGSSSSTLATGSPDVTTTEEEGGGPSMILIGGAVGGVAAVGTAAGVAYALRSGEPAPLDVHFDQDHGEDDDEGPREMYDHTTSQDYQ